MEARRERRPSSQPRFPPWLETITVVAVMLALFGLYLGVAHLLVVQPETTDDAGLHSRDSAYFALHGAVLLVGIIAGVVLGAMLRRPALAFGVLFSAVLFTGLVGVQVGTFKLACEGHNDIVRHWQC